jgi:hypothetical protein
LKKIVLENKIIGISLIGIAILLFIIPEIQFGNKGYGNFFGYNIGYYLLPFVFLYYLSSRFINKLGFNGKAVWLKLIIFILLEILCIYQFSVSKEKFNNSIDTIQSMITSSPNKKIPAPELSNKNDDSMFSRRADSLGKLSYALTKVREQQVDNDIKINQQEDVLIRDLENDTLPSNLLKDGGISRAEDTVKKYNKLILEKRNAIDSLYKKMNEEVAKLGLSKSDLDEYTMGEKAGRKQYNDIYDIQEEELAAYKELLYFIKVNIAKIKVNNNQFVFYSNETQQQYNNLINNLAELSSKENVLISKHVNELDNFKKSLNEAKI